MENQSYQEPFTRPAIGNARETIVWSFLFAY